MDVEISTLEKELKFLSNSVASLKSELRELVNALTDEELEKGISELEVKTVEMKKKVSWLHKARAINPEELNRLRDEVAYARKVWRKRRSKCREILGIIAEGMEKQESEVIENIGLETEENLGIPLPFYSFHLS